LGLGSTFKEAERRMQKAMWRFEGSVRVKEGGRGQPVKGEGWDVYEICRPVWEGWRNGHLRDRLVKG
jgi:hypothetical protein